MDPDAVIAVLGLALALAVGVAGWLHGDTWCAWAAAYRRREP